MTSVSRLADVLVIGFAVRPEWNPNEPLEPSRINVEKIVSRQVQQVAGMPAIVNRLEEIVKEQLAATHILGFRDRLHQVSPGAGYEVDPQTHRLVSHNVHLASAPTEPSPPSPHTPPRSTAPLRAPISPLQMYPAASLVVGSSAALSSRPPPVSTASSSLLPPVSTPSNSRLPPAPALSSSQRPPVPAASSSHLPSSSSRPARHQLASQITTSDGNRDQPVSAQDAVSPRRVGRRAQLEDNVQRTPSVCTPSTSSRSEFLL